MQAHITLLPGDGIGPEIVREGRRVLEAVGECFGHSFSFSEHPLGGAAIDRSGDPLPPETLSACRDAHAVLLGAVGGPQWDDPTARVRPEQGLLALRRALGLFANLRPIAVRESLADLSVLRRDAVKDVDIMIVRELTGGIYFGEKTLARSADGERATDLCAYSEAEIARVVRVAAALAGRRRGRLTSVDKANVLETSRLWRRVATRVVETEFPEIQLSHMLVDACAMHLLRAPSQFDVVVTENMFGDILTDEASMIVGSLGMLPSASLGDGSFGVYEPIHGSAPELAGKGVANPCATILSAAMLLRQSLGLRAEADAVERAVYETIERGCATADILPKGARPCATDEVGREVRDSILNTHGSLPTAHRPERSAF